MLQHVQVRPNLFLVQHTHKKNKTAAPAQKPPINHVWMFDRSGSMHYNLPELIEDLKAQVRTLKKGDTITLGWFSGSGQYNWIVKGSKIGDEGDFKTLDKMLDKHVMSVGMTCFSEILQDTKQVLEDLKDITNNFSMMFFTDGYPTVGNPNKEIESILTALKDISGQVSTALLVAYGNYYNKSLMTDMAEKLGAGLIHSEGLPEFRIAMDAFLGDARSANKKIKVTLDDIPYSANQTKYQSAFSLSGSTVNILSQDPDQSVWLSESDDVLDYVYVLSSEKPKNSQEVRVTEKDVKANSSLVQGVYAAAFVLTQLAKTDQAQEVLATVGDVALIDRLTNAYTPSEYGEAEKALVAAAQDKDSRLLKGYNPKYLPDPNAFCILDALDVLLDDPQAAFYPYHKSFHYKRIGVKSEVVDDAPEFVPDRGVKVPVSALVWNSSMLNLSVYAKIDGKIKLTGDYKKLGFAQSYPTWINRNYTIVKDGFLNVKVLPVSLSETSFNKLKAEGMIAANEVYEEDEIYDLLLDRVPVINRAMAEGKTSATKLADKVIREHELKAQLKALKYFKDQELGETTEKVGVFASLSDEQISLLEKHYIGKNGFSPKVEKGESIDHYFAKEFEVKVKGLSSLPKITDVQTKVQSGKKLTVSDELVKAGIDLYEKSGVTTMAKEVKLAWLNQKIGELLKEQRGVSREIQETKFAVLLAKKWFDEFSSREENTLTHKGHTLTFSLREVKVPF